MRRGVFFIAAIALSGLFVPRQIPAHHALASEFDPGQMLTITGTISEVLWANPHVAVRVIVRDSSGRAELWAVRGDSPANLERIGWTRRAFVIGQQLFACGYPSTRGQREISGEQVALASGVRLPFATDVKRCTNVDLRRANERQNSATTQRSNNPTGLMTNPVGAMANPVSPMANPISPMTNPIAPAGNPTSQPQR